VDVLVALEHRFVRTPDGVVWTERSYARPFWQRYLDEFSAVRVLARVRDASQPPPDGQPASGDRVAFAPVPHFVGPWQFLRRLPQVRRAVREALDPPDALILRVPGTLGNCVSAELRGRDRPFGVEVVGDPYDVFAPGSVKSFFRGGFRWWYASRLRRQCATACAAAYVTERALQQRYPPAAGAYVTHYSSIELGDEAFVSEPRTAFAPRGPYHLVFVGTLEQLYKAPDVLIHAVARLRRDGTDAHLTIIGDGQYRPALEQQAAQLGLAECIRFAGLLPPGEAVRAVLDQADLFVLPSHQEGLPRAMIEAMARGLPCVGSTAGGIPELLPPFDLVPPGDAVQLARKLDELLRDPDRRAAAAARNLATARQYHDRVLQERRRLFFRALRDRTAAWLASRPNGVAAANRR